METMFLLYLKYSAIGRDDVGRGVHDNDIIVFIVIGEYTVCVRKHNIAR